MDIIAHNTADNKTVEVTKFAAALWNIKQEEAALKERKLKVEETLIELLGCKPEGATTHNIREAYKVTITGKVTRTLDEKEWSNVALLLPADMHPVKNKLVLETAGIKWMMENEPGFFKIMSKALMIKPAKTAVAVKEFKK